ncbi:hypothetical protein QP868_04960 [Brevibacterium sp. UMB1308A]|uniref:hypothetical protein n=1 Tax=Brevibacterium sp. UMB1308A TaxID=3050608 RepID=UPI00254D7295|nr:hypothetical protein [Brevibacterium sp. UMB1308A]MDK8345642.1 hypothetical protein [Brevibacterium sp. UMB1308B]MDK8713244.1 hypothetical protein [Brevibacterium sp. UMB1308A]
MARIKQRYLAELEHEFNTTGQVTLRVRPVSKMVHGIVLPSIIFFVWAWSLIVVWRIISDGTWENPLAWVRVAGYSVIVVAVPAVTTFIMVSLVRSRSRDRLRTHYWVITREGLYPPDATRTSGEIPPLFYTWDGINDIEVGRFPIKLPWPPATAVITPRLETIERVQFERPGIKDESFFYYPNGSVRSTYITWTHTPDARTLASFLQTCKKRYSLSAQDL